jgi:hypothetical protein
MTIAEFEIQTDLADAREQLIRAPKGIYRVKILDVVVNPKDHKATQTSLQIDLVVVEGTHAGETLRTWVRAPDSDHFQNAEKDNKRAKDNFYTMLLSGGVPEAKARAEKRFGTSPLRDLTFGVSYVPKDEAMGIKYDNVYFLKPEVYAMRTAQIDEAPVDAKGVETLDLTQDEFAVEVPAASKKSSKKREAITDDGVDFLSNL